MPTEKTDYLVDLVKSMTKSEKRSFKLFAQRNQNSDDLLFIKLFEEINKRKDFREDEILKNISGIKKSQLSNLKSHLYKQLMLSMRMINRDAPDFAIREGLDQAKLLYNKGLYKQSLEILDKSKSKAKKYHYADLVLMIIDFEKFIESQHITNAFGNRADILEEESSRYLKRVERIQKLADLSLKMYSYYLKNGYVRTQKEYETVTKLYEENLPIYDVRRLRFYEKMYLYKSNSWYHYVTHDFAGFYGHSMRWLNTFKDYPEMLEVEFSMYLKAIHNVLTGLFIAENIDRFESNLQLLEKAMDLAKKPTWNDEGMHALYTHMHKLNLFMLKGQFSRGIDALKPLQKLIKQNPYNWDEYRIMVFKYKIACLYFGAGRFGEAIKILNYIINQKSTNIRSDIQSFSRILSLIAHYELGNEKLIEYQAKSVYRFLSKTEELQDVQIAILGFLKEVMKSPVLDIKDHFKKLKIELDEISKNPFQNRAFLYLDIVSWLDSKLRNITVEEVRKEKYYNSLKQNSMS